MAAERVKRFKYLFQIENESEEYLGTVGIHADGDMEADRLLHNYLCSNKAPREAMYSGECERTENSQYVGEVVL